MTQGAMGPEGRVALPLVEDVRGAEPIDVRDVAVVEMRVPPRGLSLSAGRAVALIP